MSEQDAQKSSSSSAGAAWDAERERSRATQAKKSEKGRDIAPMPAVVNPQRKAQGATSYAFFCRTYFPHIFDLEWSDDHLDAIVIIETVVLHGGQFAYAMPRASGKTTLAEAAVLWSTLYGYRQFPFVIGSEATSALEILESVQKELETNDLLLEDFPEVCYPIRCLEGITQRCAGQLYNGKRTHMHWASDCLVLPTIPGSKASGCIVAVAGITGRIRGMKFKRADGRSVRPDLVLLDDPQTAESARSPSQCATRKRLINADVMGLAGPGKEIAALMPCTVIVQGDLSDDLLDREKNPQWRGKRTAMVRRWPKNQALWDEYAEILAADLRADGDGKPATAFYAAKRAAMDEQFDVSWPARKSPKELSAQQHAMNLRLKVGDAAFFAEYQNAPLLEIEGEPLLTAAEINKKRNGHKRGVVPMGREHVTAYIDVQGNMLFWIVVAWSKDFTGDVLDYGTWPEQRSPYFTKRDARQTLKRTFPKMGQMAQIYAAAEALCTKLKDKAWMREDGTPMYIERCPIDANWGTSTETIYKFCREFKWHNVLIPSHGRGVRASEKPYEQYTAKEGERIGDHWMMPTIKNKRAVRHLLIDTNYWKTSVHAGLNVSMGDPGCLALFGAKPKAGTTDELHRLIADHWAAEYCVAVKANGRTVNEFKVKPGDPDNDLLDCITGAAAAASMLGCRVLRNVKAKRVKAKPAKVNAPAAPAPPALSPPAAAAAAAAKKKKRKRRVFDLE